jgi:hypothetical protein
MRRDRAGDDLLGTLERCLASVRGRADAAGITIELAIPVNPVLLGADVTPLGPLFRHLLSYAISRATAGDRLLARVDIAPDGTVAVAIDEEGASTDHAVKPGRAGATEEVTVEPARAILEAAGGRLFLSPHHSGRVHVLATLPGRRGEVS